MQEIALSALDDRLRQLALNARKALRQGDPVYALTVLREVFREAPGCAEMRRTWWDALCAVRGHRGAGWSERLRGILGAGRGGLARTGPPLAALTAAAERIERAPRSTEALRALAGAANRLGWSATECFAWEAVVGLAPAGKTPGLAWIDALQRHGDLGAAQRALDRLQAAYPHDGDVRAAGRALGVARALRDGRWDQSGSFRDKLRE